MPHQVILVFGKRFTYNIAQRKRYAVSSDQDSAFWKISLEFIDEKMGHKYEI